MSFFFRSLVRTWTLRWSALFRHTPYARRVRQGCIHEYSGNFLSLYERLFWFWSPFCGVHIATIDRLACRYDYSLRFALPNDKTWKPARFGLPGENSLSTERKPICSCVRLPVFLCWYTMKETLFDKYIPAGGVCLPMNFHFPGNLINSKALMAAC